jgi:RND family efflux transporter MFP subunit
MILRSAAIILLALLIGCGEQEQAPKKDVVRPVRAIKIGDTAPYESWLPGRAKATKEVNLSFRVGGPLIDRPVKVGDEVKAGDIVARIDPRDFEVNVRNVEAQLERAKALRAQAEREHKRGLDIQKRGKGLISESELDLRLRKRDESRAEVKTLEASLESAKDDLSYTYLKAPFDGVIVATYVENFEDVQAKQSIVRILDHSRIEMVINIPESGISNSPYVKRIRVVFDAFPDRELAAEIKEIGKEASTTTRTYPVTLIMDQPEDVEIVAGMSGKAFAEIQLPEHADQSGVEVPVSAIFSDKETQKTFAWVIDEATQTVSRREVTPSTLTDRGIRVQGLRTGDWIATAGVHHLREGQKVRLMQNREG